MVAHATPIVNPFTNDNVCEKYYGNVIWDLLVCRLYSFLCICGKHMTFRVCRAHHPVRATLHYDNFFGHTRPRVSLEPFLSFGINQRRRNKDSVTFRHHHHHHHHHERESFVLRDKLRGSGGVGSGKCRRLFERYNVLEPTPAPAPHVVVVVVVIIFVMEKITT